jgi:YHS domain-containing protein
MNKTTFYLVFALICSVIVINAIAENKAKEADKAVEANTWTTMDGAKHFVCPVMGGEGMVDENTTFSTVDDKKYYHCCAGCSEKFTANPAKHLKDFYIPANVVKSDKDGQHFQCVVSGEMGLVDTKTDFAEIDGKRYYFCCPDCKPKFEKNPGKYIRSKHKEHNHEHHK